MKHEGIVGVGPPVKQSTAETLDIDNFLNSIICDPCQRWRTWAIFFLFQNISNCRLPASAKKVFQHRISGY
jgi:hypothetical protein